MQGFPTDILEALRLHLEEEKRIAVDRINELSKQDPFTDNERTNDNASDDTDANEESSHDRFSAMVDETQAKVDEIDAALARIGDGTYGFCTECKQMIDTDRLSILPTATLCKSCEEKKKKR